MPLQQVEEVPRGGCAVHLAQALRATVLLGSNQIAAAVNKWVQGMQAGVIRHNNAVTHHTGIGIGVVREKQCVASVAVV
jgi:hypothetical protein